MKVFAKMSNKNRIHNKAILFPILSLIFGFILLLISANRGSALSENDTTPPRTIQNFSIKSLDNSFELTWNENSEWDIFTYLLYVRKSDEKESKPILLGRVNHYTLSNLNQDTTYYLSISARDISGNENKPTPEIGITPLQNKILKDFIISAWQPGQDIEEGQKVLENNLHLFDQFSPFEYKVEEDGKITQVTQVLGDDLKEKLKSKSIKVIPTLTNNFDENDKASNILGDEQKRNGHRDNILKEVEEKGYDGIDLDYENLKMEVKNDYSKFIRELSEKLHEKGKILSVTLQAKNSDYEIWRGTGASDYEEIGKYADQVRIMTYDFSRINTNPGAISPIRWFREIINYSKSKISPKKIIIGIPFYGYKWCLEKKNDDCQNKGLVFEGVKNIIDKYKPEVKWNDETKTPWFMYEDENHNKFVADFEDHASLKEKLEVVKDEEVGGIVIWRLGGEDQENFKIINEELAKIPSQPKNLKITPDNNSIHLEWEDAQYKDLKGYKIIVKPKDEDNLTSDNKSYSREQTFEALGKTKYDIMDLENGKQYYINFEPLLWSEDINPSLAENIEKTKPILAAPQDAIYPMTVFDLKTEEIGTTTIKLSWTGPGDDRTFGKAKSYDLRYSTSPITQENFEQAKKYEEIEEPKEANSKEELTLADLEPGETYYIALRTFDEAENFSDISNIATAETIDNIPPKVPAIPQIFSENKSLKLHWPKNQEKDLAGYKIFYKQEKSYYQEISVDANATSYTLKNLENGYQYFVSLSAFDRHGNESARSEDAFGQPAAGDLYEKSINAGERGLEIAKGQASVFGKKLLTQEAIPYLVMFSIIVLNFFIYQALKSEIHDRKTSTLKSLAWGHVGVAKNILMPQRKTINSKIIAHKKPLGPRIIDLKKGKYTLK